MAKGFSGRAASEYAVFTLEPDPRIGENAIFKSTGYAPVQNGFAQHLLEFDSFCIAEGKIYCSAFVNQGEDNTMIQPDLPHKP